MGHTFFPKFLLAVFISGVVSSSTPTNLSHIFFFYASSVCRFSALPTVCIHCQTRVVIYWLHYYITAVCPALLWTVLC
jgi:hypothetical protein